MYIIIDGNPIFAKRYVIGPTNSVNKIMIVTNNAKLAISYH